MKNKIEIDISKINQIDLTKIFNQVDTGGRWVDGWSQFVNAKAGQKYYKLLAYLSTFFESNQILIDLGTLTGASSLALSYNKNIKVYSFDLPKQTFHNGVPGTDMFVYESEDQKLAKNNAPNIEYIIGDCLKYPELLLNSSLIFIDIDHSGIVEKQILDFLRKNNWNGLALLDDIHWGTMLPIWNEVPEPKWNLSFCGNGADGTGLINFGNKYEVIINQ